ncbi:MAG TPA: hypothetical protein DEP47_03395 [Chloroflexi bacterium]|nr:hypothetical protein [Chloroflexota bacterium]
MGVIVNYRDIAHVTYYLESPSNPAKVCQGLQDCTHLNTQARCGGNRSQGIQNIVLAWNAKPDKTHRFQIPLNNKVNAA